MTPARIEALLAAVDRGPSTPRERSMATAIRQLRSQHDFAFSSWQQAVKRSGRLSADLDETKTRFARASTDLARTMMNLPDPLDDLTVVVPTDDETKTRVRARPAAVIQNGVRR